MNNTTGSASASGSSSNSSSSSGADSGASGAQGSQGDQGSQGGQGGSEGSSGEGASSSSQSTAKLSVDPLDAGFYDRLSPEDQARFDAGDFQFAVEGDTTGTAGATDPKAGSEGEAGSKAESAGDASAPISAEQFAKLSPNVQSVLREAQAMIADEDFKTFKASQNALNQLLEHPEVISVIDRMRRGNALSYDPKAVFTGKNVQDMAAAAGVDLKSIDFQLNPEGALESMSKLFEQVHQRGIDAGTTLSKMEARQEAARQELKKMYDDGFSALKNEVPGAKDLHEADPKSPLNPFYAHLEQSLKSGILTHESVRQLGIRPLYMAYLEKTGQLQNLLNKPAANARARFFEEAATAATQAVTASSSQAASARPQMQSKHGIDPTRFLNDLAYQNEVYQVHGENESVLADLQKLSFTGTW